MKKKRTLSICFLAAFVFWTILVKTVDVQTIGPEESAVGFSHLNALVHNLTGVNWCLYSLTDWLSIIPLGFVGGFAIMGLCQWIHRKSLRKVDGSLLILGGFYFLVMVIFLLFEAVVINYRPVLIDGVLESSYPSSTTLLVLCVMPTVWIRLRHSQLVSAAIVLFTAFMVLGRILSGVHWITDVIGGVLLSTGLVLAYASIEKSAP